MVGAPGVPSSGTWNAESGGSLGALRLEGVASKLVVGVAGACAEDVEFGGCEHASGKSAASMAATGHAFIVRMPLMAHSFGAVGSACY